VGSRRDLLETRCKGIQSKISWQPASSEKEDQEKNGRKKEEIARAGEQAKRGTGANPKHILKQRGKGRHKKKCAATGLNNIMAPELFRQGEEEKKITSRAIFLRQD